MKQFGATLYYFGREIHDKTHLPVGLILSAVGGQRIEPFIPREGFENTSELMDTAFNIAVLQKRKGQYTEAAMDKFDQIAAWVEAARQARAEKKQAPQFPALYAWGDPQPPHRATMLFNPNICPLIPFGIRGVVWYQGEGNEFEQESYAIKMRALVNGWRQCWKRPELPFYFAQIASAGPAGAADDRPEGWAGIGYQKVRMGQLQSLRAIPHSGMAVSLDIGGGDLHPKNKQDLARRLSLWALKNEYGIKEIVPSGPLFRAMRIEGEKARISFDYAETGLMAGEKTGLLPVREVPDGGLKGFAIAGEDQKWHWAKAVIEGGEVVVSSPDVLRPTAVRYAFTMNPEGCNLYNKAGLPASPFRTDEW